MKTVRSFIFCIRQGFKNIRRNKMFSLASVSTIAACIFLIGMFYAIVVNFQYIIDNAQKQIGISVFFDNDIEDEKIKAIGEQIKARSEVDTVTYISEDEAWDKFKKSYFGDYPELAEGFKDDNPLINSESYEVFLKDLTLEEGFVKYVKAIPGVRKVNYSKQTSTTITDFARLIGYASIGIIAILLAVGIFLISNTVMIGIAVRKEEIKIMKLTGATNLFVRAPFIVEGVVIGLIGACIPLVLIYGIYKKAVVYVIAKFQGLSSLVVFLPAGKVFVVLIPLALGVGAGIGFVGSMISIRKHLKV
ncbi:permease-like cell division protein FtsX [Eubacterium uniforme]|uniref:Cell division protein FtsX n=1 Tax=Eubacterium uniforme TaxID=39495 RepID=A0A1T4VXC4_9FIRM|nr:permease-like cell division protein FtsX [Eubacterium uniforme]SKA69141.1 cell division protein FtsX [Eubacterium uniforme]HAH18003.1 ABC transporter permease [Eubacterium sp.]HAV89708.1 ABC transporter permease [Eubacterium sp.]